MADAFLPSRIYLGQVCTFMPGSSFLTKEQFEILKIIIILKGEMLNLYLEDTVAVKNVDIASSDKDRKPCFSTQMHEKEIKRNVCS